MTSRASKNTRASKRRASNKTERPSSKLERAEAVIYVHDTGGMRVRVENPFFQETSSRDTLHYVCCGLDALSQANLQEANFNSDASFGLSLILHTFGSALRGAGDQVKNELQYAAARGAVDGLKDGGQ